MSERHWVQICRWRTVRNSSPCPMTRMVAESNVDYYIMLYVMSNLRRGDNEYSRWRVDFLSRINEF